MAVLKNVTRWLDDIHTVRDAMGLTSAQYPDAVVLALMHIESHGDDYARRPNSSFHGILQIAKPYMMDGTGEDDVDPKDLMGDVKLSLAVFFGYMERYEARHDYHPSLIAALHKGGAGTGKTVYRKFVVESTDLDTALEFAANRHNIPRLKVYVDRFRAALQNYAVWVDDQNKPYGVCSTEVMGDE